MSTVNGPTAEIEQPYPSVNVMVAALVTIAAPFISLLAALVLRAEETNRVRRQQLTQWAIASGVWLGVGGLIVIAAFASVAGSASPGSCKGGIDRLEPPSYYSSDGKHWTAEYLCMNGGSTTRPAHAAWLNK